MDIHYNAFISYRHHPDDIRVATEIHRLLERFHIPKGLRGKITPIERIFRDKEELPITSSLTDNITAALRNSDYLIVICSQHTKESVWVQREIETFLQTHSRNKILTVLCGGEPYEVIPEILLYEQVQGPVTGEMIRRDVEPLSCDWRLPSRQARREELPRLAAVLLGCGYDDLRQRQRHYRMRRLMAVMSAAVTLSLGLAGYFLYTSITIQKANVQIRENLDEALRNQSRFLANAAQERLDAGDRMTAIALAMEALPEYPGERPYVPDGEYVLSKALGVYGKEDIVAVGALGRGENSILREFWISEIDPVAVLNYDNGKLTTWNTQTMQQIAVLPLETTTVDEVIFLERDVLVVRSSLEVCAMTVDGKKLWAQNYCFDMDMLPDGTLLVLGSEVEKRKLFYVDPYTGKQTRPAVDLTIAETDCVANLILDGCMGPDCKVVLRYWSSESNEIVVLDPNTGELRLVLRDVPYNDAYMITGDGRVLMMRNRNSAALMGTYYTYRVSGALTYDIVCHDLDSGKQLWSSQLCSYAFTGIYRMDPIPNSDRILCISGNVLQIMDGNTGEVLSHCEAGNGILDVKIGEESAVLVLRDGYLCDFYYDDDKIWEYPYLEDKLIQGMYRSGDAAYALQRDSMQVTVYRTIGGVYQWEADLGQNVYVFNERIHGDKLAFTNSGKLYLFDYARQEMLLEQEVGYIRMRDFSNDGSRIWMVDSFSELVTIYTEDGHITREEFPQEWDGQKFYPGMTSGNVLFNDQLYYTVMYAGEGKLVRWDLNSGATQTWDLEGFNMADTVLLCCSDSYVWLRVAANVYALDLQDGSIHLMLEDVEADPVILSKESSRVFVGVGTAVYGYDGLQSLVTISLENANGCTALAREEDIFILCDDARVYRFDYSGQKLAQTEVEIYNTFAANVKNMDPYLTYWYELPDNKIMVNALGVVSVIDYENWGLCSGIANVVDYDPERDILLLNTSGKLYGYTLYSMEELLDIAGEQLNGYTLTEAEFRYYGIG